MFPRKPRTNLVPSSKGVDFVFLVLHFYFLHQLNQSSSRQEWGRLGPKCSIFHYAYRSKSSNIHRPVLVSTITKKTNVEKARFAERVFFFSPQGSGIPPFFVALTNPSSRILVAHIRSSCPTAAPPTQRPESMHQQNKRSALSFFPIIQDSSDACISLCQSVQSLLRTKFQTPLRHKLQIPTRDHYPIILSTIFLQFLFLIFFYTKIFFQLPLQFSLSYDHISHPIHTSK